MRYPVDRLLGHVRWPLARLRRGVGGVRALLAGLALTTALTAGCGSGTAEDRRSSTGEANGGEVTLGAGDTPARTPPRPARRRPAKRPARAQRPPIRSWPIPFPAKRRAETVAYTRRHYGRAVTALRPRVIVEHYSVTPTARGVHDLFARDVPDVELRELPGVCAHFVIDRDGTIYQLVALTQVCRHTVGLNQVAVGIEHVGSSDQQVLDNPRQLGASLRLTAWLRCRYGIGPRDVIGHAESLSSPYHREDVAALRHQTHDDFQRASMDRYRSRLAARRC